MHDINLIPAARLVRRRRNTRLCVWGAACGAYAMCLIAGSTTLHALGANEGRNLNGQSANLAQQIKQQNLDLLGIRKEFGETTRTVEMAQAIHHQPDWSQLFLDLSDRLGDEIVLGRCELATLTQDNKAVMEQWAKAMPAKPLGTLLTECRYTLSLSGFGKSQEAVSRFVLRLESSGIFQVVRLANSNRQTFLNDEAVAFSVECYFKGS